MTDRLYAAIAKQSNENKCNAIAIGGIEDHIHLLVCLHPTVCVADLVQQVKGSTSHLMYKEIRPGKNFRWQGAYGAFSVHENDVERVKEYILNQKDHHANNALLSYFERTDIVA